MLKKGMLLFLILIFFQLIFVSNLWAQETNIENKENTSEVVKEKNRQKVTGKITEIAVDGTNFTIGDKKIITTKEFLDDSFIAVGDNVEITVEETPQGIRAIDYKYIFEEGSDSSGLDENLNSPNEFDIDIPGE